MLERPVTGDHRRDEWTGPLPHGLDPARSALQRWVGHRTAGIEIADPPPIAVGETVAMAIPVGPIWATATARIIDVVDEPDRYGFTYTTLPHHPEDGEESFIVARDEHGECRYTISAVWRPATFGARLLPPLTRILQRRAIGHYLSGVATWEPEHERSR